VLATDAMADHDPDSHRHSLERIFPKLGETATSAEITGFLDRRLGRAGYAARRPWHQAHDSRLHGQKETPVMPANPLGAALRNRRAGHHTLVWARPDSAGPGELHPDQPRLRPRGTHPGKHRGRTT
jgi:hypothetical protein